MKGKRPLRPDESPDTNSVRTAKRTKPNNDVTVSPAFKPEFENAQIRDRSPSSIELSSKKPKSRPLPGLGDRSILPNKAEDWELGQPRHSNSWGVSCRSGGRILDLDPVYSIDEKYAPPRDHPRYILLARDSAVQIYSIATSSLIRTLQIPVDLKRITRYRLSPVNPEHLFVATRSGHIIEWNWNTGQWIQSWDISKSILAMDAIAVTENDSEPFDNPAIYTICKRKGENFEIVMSIKENGSEDQLWKQSVIYKTSRRLTNLRVAARGQVIVATAGAYLVVGQTSKDASQKKVERTWRELRLPVYTTCFDIRESSRPNKSPRNQLSPSAEVDLVIGESEGAILIYHDLVDTLLRCESKGELNAGLVSRRLHWHRDIVKTVRWSRDGNYLISGGLETVLVLWQLDTGRKQFLPHLTSPICNLVVSPSGISYAIKLADNSAMVLSTSELRPIASISGLQLPSYGDIREPKRHLKTKKWSSSQVGGGPFHKALPARLHPVQSDHLLMAVPSSQTSFSTDMSPSASFLQTFDARSNQHISRQALARTNVSILHTGPEGTELTTPDTKFIEISSDGDWLVTVDEWEQYPESMGILTPINEPGEQRRKREIFLKFWHWNETNGEWELVTRIDGPHVSPLSGSMPIRGLAVSPNSLSFATVGDDGVVRFWTPEFRPNHSKKQGKGRSVKTWRCSRNVALEKLPTETGSVSQMGSCLGFSEDGSALAVCWTARFNSGTGLVYIIDPQTGQICHTREGLFSGTPQGCGFLDRHLIILSDHLVSWHTVTNRIVFAFALTDKHGSQSFDRYIPLLALNRKNKTFAITFPGGSRPESELSKSHSKSRFQIAVFEPTIPDPLFQSKLKYAPRALLSNVKSGDYIIIDSAAEVLQVSSSDHMAQVPDETSAIDLPFRTGLEDIFGSRRLLSQQNQSELDVRGHENVQVKGLADVFDVGPSFALPSTDVLFRDVVDVLGSKPVEA
ncbi:NET1-associated nuclear protein 1 [Emydomyces testavorans]|uniref:NET1-associated nuclear protein 1 n=1 Tax=Emydomyces testavorans TaxID=2070801 RepID=A0AAF0IJP9_9EURO|nr:NET1-associated nuclear protein 1 [Emydomyces testavorans]